MAEAYKITIVIELKLRSNGGKDAATRQILNRQYLEPFKADKRQVIGLGIELDEEGNIGL